MPALIQFVDSIASSPTVRLDVNNATTWFCQSFKAPPPRLRRSVSANAMRDGDHVSSSSYENRTLELELTLIEEADEDFAAQEMQNLWRELDRPTNLLRYQPEGMTKPVFFRLFRSDVSDLEELWTTPIARTITLELLAEPFAVGLKQPLGPFVVNNNPAGVVPTYFDVTGALGDVPAPLVWWDNCSVAHHSRLVATQHRPTTADLQFVYSQAESLTLLTDTTNPGGGPDDSMSGTGANNYRRTSFATAAMTSRLRWSTGLNVTGQWRLLAVVRKNGTTSSIGVRAQTRTSASPGATTTIAAATSGRMLLDLGIFLIADDEAQRFGLSVIDNPVFSNEIDIQASRTGGSDTLDYDFLMLVPAGGQRQSVMSSTTVLSSVTSAANTSLDAVKDSVGALLSAGDPTTGSVTPDPYGAQFSGSLPWVAPGALVANRYHVLPFTTSTRLTQLSATTTVSLAYWPRYLYVRPSAS